MSKMIALGSLVLVLGTHTSLGNFRGATETWTNRMVVIRTRKSIGTSYMFCVRVTADVRQCGATFGLPEGVLTAQGVLHTDTRYSLTITGGTGAYLGFGGWVAIRQINPDAPHPTAQLTFNLRG
jgi:hypothetical protein